MSDSGSPGTSTWTEGVSQWTAELGRMVALRRELAALEIHHDRQLARRCLIVGISGAVLALVAVPLLLHTAADWLAQITSLDTRAWNAILGSVLVVPGVLLLIVAIRKFRAEFCGLRGTLAELNEDLIWLREWTRTDAHAADGESPHDAPQDEANVERGIRL